MRNVVCSFDVTSNKKNTYRFKRIAQELAQILFINKRPLDYENIETV